MSVTLGDHLWQMALLAGVIAGPVPLILVMARWWSDLLITERLITVLLTWSASQVVVGQVLGHLGILRLEVVLGLYAGLALGVMFLVWRGRVQLAVPRWPRALSLNKWTGLLIGALAIVAVLLVVKLLLYPTLDYDSLNYHLPVMARWYNTHSLVMEKWHREAFLYFPEYYPYDWEVLGTLFILPAREAFAVMLPNIMAWSLLGLSIFSITKRLGVPSTYALTGSVLVLTTPLAINLLFTLHVDLAFGAFFLAALACLLAFYGTHKRAAALACGIALALAIGTKTTGIIYAALLFMAGAVTLKWPWAQLIRARRVAALFTVITGVSAMLIGGGWYIRNWLEMGNPLYPIRLALGNVTVFPGVIAPGDMTRTTLGGIFDVQRGEHWAVVLTALQSELGWTGLALVGLGVVGIIAALFGRRSMAHSSQTMLIVLLTGLGLVLYVTSPFSGDNSNTGQVTSWIGGQMRLAIPVLGLWSILAILGAKVLRLPERWLVLIGILACGWTLYQSSPEWFLGGAAMATTGLLIASRYRDITRLLHRPLISGTVVILLAISTMLASYMIRLEHDVQRQAAYGNVQDWLDEHLTENDRLGYVLALTKYLLYGRHLDRNNEFIPLDAASSQTDWLTLLRTKGITYFAIGPLRSEWLSNPQIKWLEDRQFFEKVFGNDATREPVIYRLRPVGAS